MLQKFYAWRCQKTLVGNPAGPQQGQRGCSTSDKGFNPRTLTARGFFLFRESPARLALAQYPNKAVRKRRGKMNTGYFWTICGDRDEVV